MFEIEKNENRPCPQKEMNHVLQPSIFRDSVSFREGILSETSEVLMNDEFSEAFFCKTSERLCAPNKIMRQRYVKKYQGSTHVKAGKFTSNRILSICFLNEECTPNMRPHKTEIYHVVKTFQQIHASNHDIISIIVIIIMKLPF